MGNHNPQTHLLPPLEVFITQLANQILERLSMAFTANDKRQKLNFCRLSSAVCTVE